MQHAGFIPTHHAPTLILAAAIALAGCGGGDSPTNNDDDPTGSIQASVTADAAARSGVTVRVLDVGATQPRATQTTSSAGTAVFGNLPVASYDVDITVPTGFTLASGQTASRRVTVTANNQAAVAFALVASGGGGGGGDQIINIQGLAFSPSDVTISAGTRVTWRNPDNTFHTVTPDGHTAWVEANLPSAGSSFSHTFNETGTFAYYCSPHRGAGMTGIIRVQ
ncbi:MAG: plastocyanin/azurin family copper-binding protein [Gemmatimonadota bacterium]